MATSTVADAIVDHWNPVLPSGWLAKAQQTQDRLRPFVTNHPLSGEITFIDQINARTQMRPKTQRFQRVEIKEGTYDRRAIQWTAFDDTAGFDEHDYIKLGVQSVPVMQTMTEMANLAHRTSELGIITAITGTNYAGKAGSTPITLGTDRIIPWNFNYDGTTTARGMTLDKFARARRKFMEDEIYGEGVQNGTDTLCAALSASQIEDMLHDAFLNDKHKIFALEKLRDFEVDSFMGVKILRTQQAPTRLEGGLVIRQVPFWLKSRVHFGFAKDWTIEMWVEKMLSNAILMRGQMAFGGTRTEEKGVLIVECVENPV